MIRKALITVAVCCAAVVLTYIAATIANASPTPTKHDHDVVRFFRHHPALAATPAGGKALLRAAGDLDVQVRSLQAIRAAKARAASAWPDHHALWGCIHDHEAGSWDAVNPNGHYGGLQMSYGWLGYIDGRASDHSQLEQEQAAERAYADSGYSSSFLYGQWFDYEVGGSVCLAYA